MKKTTLLGSLGLMMLMSVSPPASANHVRYSGHVQFALTSCCGLNQVVLKAFGRSDVRYRVCVTKPDGSKKCKDGVTGASGRPSRKTFGSSAVGVFHVVWKVNGRVVDSSQWRNVAEGV